MERLRAIDAVQNPSKEFTAGIVLFSQVGFELWRYQEHCISAVKHCAVLGWGNPIYDPFSCYQIASRSMQATESFSLVNSS